VKAPALHDASFTLPVRVYYEDTDAGGVVYHANYLKFMERGRTEWLRKLGFEQAALARDPGVVFVLRRLEIEFLRPAGLDAELAVVTSVKRLRATSVEFDQRIVARDGDPVCTGVAVVVCVDAARFRPSPIPTCITEGLAVRN
jgi:acyl-CoA thioester hydrolase